MRDGSGSAAFHADSVAPSQPERPAALSKRGQIHLVKAVYR